MARRNYNHPLSAALDKLSCLPSVSFSLRPDEGPVMSIAGEAAGTLMDPAIDLILKKSVPSAFGRGEQTVMDPTYRSGREIQGSDIMLDGSWLTPELQAQVSASMFVGRRVEVNLHKLAIYEPGGHFDWHRDSTHSDKHHATILVALNTHWTGGDLILRHGSLEARIALQPTVTPDESNPGDLLLQAVAFYTDTEHKVEPVSDGVRIVLQYDVEVVGAETDYDDEEEDESDDAMDIYEMESELVARDELYERRAECRENVPVTGDPALLAKIIAIIQELHASGQTEVSFPLQHLYRKASIRPKYLKGSDAVLHEALAAVFDVAIRPVVLKETHGESFEELDLLAYNYDKDIRDKKDHASKSARFYLPKVSAIQMIGEKEYIEYTGNESQLGEYRYFGGGMFVKPKNSA